MKDGHLIDHVIVRRYHGNKGNRLFYVVIIIMGPGKAIPTRDEIQNHLIVHHMRSAATQ